MATRENQIKLTISILVSNRKDTVPKCLESLRPLLDRVDSELIISDTGCDDDLVEFMRQYTDNIVKFKWCNDFAVARNVGLEMAKGQWFMFIDDDEWFEDVSEIIDFFNSDEEKNYEAGSYVVRNYKTLEGKTYTESLASRMFRIKDGIKFIGKVHEHIPHGNGKEKRFASYAHHYGYAFDDSNKKKLHYERNTSLLKKEIEEKPGEARSYAHLFQEFRAMGKIDEALEYAFKALECVVEETRENKFSMCSTYVCILWCYLAKAEYENVIKWGKEFLGSKPITGLTKAAIVSYMAEAYKELTDYENGLKAVDEFVRLLEMYRIEKERYYFEQGPLLNVFVQPRRDAVLGIGLEMAITIKDIMRATEYIEAFDWSKDVNVSENCLNGLIALMSLIDIDNNSRAFFASVKALGKLFTNIEISQIIIKLINELKSKNSQGYETICAVMSNVAGQWGYNDLVKLIATNKNNNVELLISMYQKIIIGDRSIIGMDKIFYEIALDRDIPLNEMLKEVSIDRWSLLANQWLSKMANRDLVTMKKYFDVLLNEDSEYMRIFDTELIKVLDSRKNK